MKPSSIRVRFNAYTGPTLVNLARVVKLSSHINGEFFLTLDCGARLKMSRTYKDKVAHFL